MEALLAAPEFPVAETLDLASLAISDSDRQLLAAVLMNESEELNAALLEQAVHALRHQQLERRQRSLKNQIAEAERKQDQAALARLMQEKLNVDRALSARN